MNYDEHNNLINMTTLGYDFPCFENVFVIVARHGGWTLRIIVESSHLCTWRSCFTKNGLFWAHFFLLENQFYMQKRINNETYLMHSPKNETFIFFSDCFRPLYYFEIRAASFILNNILVTRYSLDWMIIS